MNRAYRLVLHRHVENQLDGDSLEVLDMEHVGRASLKALPRITKPKTEFTALGKMVWDRTRREAERRHSTHGAALNDKDLLSTILDVRTKNAPHLSDQELAKARQLLCDHYVEYAVQCDRYQQTKEVAPASAITPHTIVTPVTETLEPPPKVQKRSGFIIGRNRFAVASTHQQAGGSWEESRKQYHRQRIVELEQKWLQLDVDWKVEFPHLAELDVENAELDMLYDL